MGFHPKGSGEDTSIVRTTTSIQKLCGPVGFFILVFYYGAGNNCEFLGEKQARCSQVAGENFPQILTEELLILGCDFFSAHKYTNLQKMIVERFPRMVSFVYLLFFGGFIGAWATQ